MSAYKAGYEYASTRSQVITDVASLSYDCGQQGIDTYGDGRHSQQLAEFGQGAMDFILGRGYHPQAPDEASDAND